MKGCLAGHPFLWSEIAVLSAHRFYFWAIHFFFRTFAPENSLFITNFYLIKCFRFKV